MQLKYTLSPEDIREAQSMAERVCRSEIERPFVLKLLMAVTVIAWVLFGAASLGMYQKYPAAVTSDLSWVVVPATVGLVGIFFLVVWSKQNFEATRLAKLGPYPIDHILSVEVRGLRIESQNGSCFLPWHVVRTVEDLPRHLAISTTSWLTLVVPDSAFSSGAAKGEFASELRRHM